MNFQSIPKVENADMLLDIAFREAKHAAERVRSTAHGKRLDKSKDIEIARLAASKQVLARRFETILRTFPAFDQINEFYRELLKCYVPLMDVKRSLAAVAWAKGKIEHVFLQSLSKVKCSRELPLINVHRRAFYGRASSFVKQINENLVLLEKTRYYMKQFPIIKEKYFTVAIAGFPNVGKTTLLSKLSGSTPEIQEYAFTTKSLNLGYIEVGGVKIQLIDTPGTLHRFDKMNAIEKQAYLAIKHCAQLVVYVFDITEPYPLEDQKKLLSSIEDLGKPIVYYLSKTDILPKQKQEAFGKEFSILSLPELKKHLFFPAAEWDKKQKEMEEKVRELEETPSEDDEDWNDEESEEE